MSSPHKMSSSQNLSYSDHALKSKKKSKGTKIELKNLGFKFSPEQSVPEPEGKRADELAKTYKSFQKLKKSITIENGVKESELSRSLFGSRGSSESLSSPAPSELGSLYGSKTQIGSPFNMDSGDRLTFGQKMIDYKKDTNRENIFGSKRYEDPESLNLECFSNMVAQLKHPH